MDGTGGGGFSLIEVLLAVAVTGVALGGTVALVAASVRGGGEAGWRLKARVATLNALEGGRLPEGEGLEGGCRTAGDLREARVAWPGCREAVRLGVWRGHG